MANGAVSQLGSVFDPSHAINASVALLRKISFASGNDTASVKLGGATEAHGNSSSSLFTPDSGADRVVASHGGSTVVGDTLSGVSGSRALDALRLADSFAGSAGSQTYTLSGGVVHDRIFVAGHLSAVTAGGSQGGAAIDPRNGASGAAAHTLLTLGENTTVSVKDVTPTLGGGHFK